MNSKLTIDCDTTSAGMNLMERRSSTLSKLSECLEGQHEYKDTNEFAQEIDFLMGKVDSILYEFHLNNGLFLGDDVSSNKSGLSHLESNSKPNKNGPKMQNGS